VLWITELEQVLGRVLPASPLGAFLDVPGLTRAVAAAFTGFGLRGLLREAAGGQRAQVPALDPDPLSGRPGAEVLPRGPGDEFHGSPTSAGQTVPSHSDQEAS
jgi:hypothetical protein